MKSLSLLTNVETFCTRSGKSIGGHVAQDSPCVSLPETTSGFSCSKNKKGKACHLLQCSREADHGEGLHQDQL